MENLCESRVSCLLQDKYFKSPFSNYTEGNLSDKTGEENIRNKYKTYTAQKRN